MFCKVIMKLLVCRKRKKNILTFEYSKSSKNRRNNSENSSKIRLDGTWRQYTRDNGMISDHVYCLQADDTGCIWAGTFADGLAVDRKSTRLNSSH